MRIFSDCIFFLVPIFSFGFITVGCNSKLMELILIFVKGNLLIIENVGTSVLKDGDPLAGVNTISSSAMSCNVIIRTVTDDDQLYNFSVCSTSFVSF
jgi:hypothetical protein